MGDTRFDDSPVPIRLKLSALWTTVMLCFIYADFFGLFLPGRLLAMNAGIMKPLGPATSVVLPQRIGDDGDPVRHCRAIPVAAHAGLSVDEHSFRDCLHDNYGRDVHWRTAVLSGVRSGRDWDDDRHRLTGNKVASW